MGTNYYAHLNECHCCHRYDELHIGKSFQIVHIHPDRNINTFADWRILLDDPDVSVWDEYGCRVELDSSLEVRAWLDQWKRYESVEHWRTKDPYADTYLKMTSDWLDSGGYHVCTAEFS